MLKGLVLGMAAALAITGGAFAATDNPVEHAAKVIGCKPFSQTMQLDGSAQTMSGKVCKTADGTNFVTDIKTVSVETRSHVAAIDELNYSSEQASNAARITPTVE